MPGGDRDRARSAFAARELRRSLAESGSATLRIRGGSMRPVLDDGAVVELRPLVRGEDLAGAIAAIDVGVSVVVHRVLGVRRGCVRTTGIASRREDAPQPEEAIIGVVKRHCGAAMGERALRAFAFAANTAYRVHRSLRRGAR